MLDCLFINVPQISLVYPPAAPSLLKGICEAAGFTARVKDYNLELYNQCTDYNIKQELDQYFSLNDHAHVLSDATYVYLNLYYDQVVADIIEINPRWLGISVFTFQCQIFTVQLLRRLRPHFPNKIMIGGAGLSTNGIGAVHNDFGDMLLEEGVIDFYIRGEGDKATVELLSGITEGPGINNDDAVQIDDLNSIANPNYDDVINLNYQWTTDGPQIPITGSRGCVRKCTFCDIHVSWKKYRYRSGESLAAEFIFHYEKYKTTNFWFTDSLINGAMKSFRDLCRILVEYYQEHNLPDKYFSWGGQFIVRDPKSMRPADFEIAARAGMSGVAMGVESLSESVRDHMKKGFSDADLDYCLEQFHKHDINCYFLILVGYPTETEKDFWDGVNKFREYKKYALDGTIHGVNLGGTLSIDEGTPLYHMTNELGIDNNNGKVGVDWLSASNPTLTFKERIRRRILLQEILMDLGYKIWNGNSQLMKLKESYEKIQNGKYKSQITIPIIKQ